MVEQVEAYYYGCKDRPGHYFWTPEGFHAETRDRKLAWSPQMGNPPEGFKPIVPWGYSVDGRLQPQGDQEEGKALTHHKDGWTALAFWDRSVDSRPGSTSTFVFNRELTFIEALMLAWELFEWVFERLDFEVVQAEV